MLKIVRLCAAQKENLSIVCLQNICHTQTCFVIAQLCFHQGEVIEDSLVLDV